VTRIGPLICALLALTSASARAQDCAPPEPGPRTLLKTSGIIFVGTVVGSKDDVYSLRVTEPFKGVATANATVAPAPGAYPEFHIGEQYLVFANPLTLDNGEKYDFVGPCSRMLPLKYAQALLEQLRAEKSGKRVASAYGMLLRTSDVWAGIWDAKYERPLPGIVISVRSRKKAFHTTTDEHGVYAFDRLPPGTYQVSADLPAGLALGELLKQGSPPPFELPRHSSFDYDLYAMPTGSIAGQVVGPNGTLRTTSVELYSAEKYDPKKPGAYAYQGEGKSFSFYHLPAGEYILVFDRRNDPSPDDPFLRTFYPGAANLAQAARIHLSSGQQLANMDIHVTNPLPTRQIMIHLGWARSNSSAYYPPQVVVSATKRQTPYAFKLADGTYTLNLFLDAQYTLKAEAYCRLPAKGELTSRNVAVDGSNAAAAKVELVLDQGGCAAK
jgi:hypothetical protein